MPGRGAGASLVSVYSAGILSLFDAARSDMRVEFIQRLKKGDVSNC